MTMAPYEGSVCIAKSENSVLQLLLSKLAYASTPDTF